MEKNFKDHLVCSQPLRRFRARRCREYFIKAYVNRFVPLVSVSDSAHFTTPYE